MVEQIESPIGIAKSPGVTRGSAVDELEQIQAARQIDFAAAKELTASARPKVQAFV